MSHYDYTPLTAEQRQAETERKERERQASIEAKKRGYAEARRLLLSEEVHGLTMLHFMQEFSRRARIHDWSMTQQITFDLEHREFIHPSDNGYRIVPTNVEEPDLKYLSDYQTNFIPEGTQDDTSLLRKNRSELNDERAILTQAIIQKHLNAGDSIFVHHADGTEEEIVFIVDPLESN